MILRNFGRLSGHDFPKGFGSSGTDAVVATVQADSGNLFHWLSDCDLGKASRIVYLALTWRAKQLVGQCGISDRLSCFGLPRHYKRYVESSTAPMTSIQDQASRIVQSIKTCITAKSIKN